MIQAMNQPFSIERPVGERETNRSDDLEAVRDALAERGLCQRTVTGQRNAMFKPDLTAGIRIFQRQAGLHPDGLVIPRGPTVMALALGERDIAEAKRELRGASILAERKQTVDAATCANWRNQVATAKNNIARLDKLIEATEALLQGHEGSRRIQQRLIDEITADISNFCGTS